MEQEQGADLALMRETGVLKVFPVSRSEWRLGIREGRYPHGFKMPGKNITFWKRSDVMALLTRIAAGAQ
jgi:hypothetical protein